MKNTESKEFRTSNVKMESETAEKYTRGTCKKKKRALCISLCMAAFLLLFIISPFFPFIRSLVVMRFYSAQCAKGSLPDTNGFEVFIPLGEGWYPFVMNFSDDNGFSAYTGKQNMRLTIFYNFPSFDLTKGCSRLYDAQSPYYNAFYGAYFVSSGDKEPYGFAVAQDDERPFANNGKAEKANIKDSESGKTENASVQSSEDVTENIVLWEEYTEKKYRLESDAVAEVARFDFFHLVLGDFGLKQEDRVFTYREIFRDEEISFIGYDGWTRIECEMKVNGAAHVKGDFARSYLQYGEPGGDCEESFAPVDMQGVIIARYFEEYDVSAFFYCMAQDKQVCLDCVEMILKKSKLTDHSVKK